MIHTRAFLLAAAFAAATVALPAQAQTATLLGVFQNWSAYQAGSGDTLTCYALSQPRAVQPKAAKRSQIYLMVSDWPGRRVKAEPQVVLGYPVKDGAAAALSIGSAKFDFFARNAGAKNEGSAWLQSLGEGDRLMAALTRGVSAVASATSARGTRTVDTYSLAGFTEAVAKIHSACNM